LLTRIYNISKIYTWNKNNNSLDVHCNKEILIDNGIICEINDTITKKVQKEINANQSILTPGFIDTHTHPVFSGNRSNEYIMRLKGNSYKYIKEKGGGIISTIKSTRESDFNSLFDITYSNIQPFISCGTTTMEAKSGYGLTLKDEIKSLQILKKINSNSDIDILSTFLGAHDIPPEYKDNRNEYIDLICNDMIPEISNKNLAVFCDVFYEPGYFTIEESRKIIKQAKKYNLIPRLHVDEFVDSKGAEFAVEMGAISADHLMAVSDKGIDVLSKSKTVATILPGTTFFLNSNNYANGRKMIDKGCTLSLASDFNPGTCTIRSLPTIMHLAMQKCGLTLEEAFLGVTYNAAMAIGLDEEIGLIKVGYKADLILWNLNELSEITYWLDSSYTKISKIFKNGNIIN